MCTYITSTCIYTQVHTHTYTHRLAQTYTLVIHSQPHLCKHTHTYTQITHTYTQITHTHIHLLIIINCTIIFHRNSGIHGGQFLERTKVAKPGSSTDNPDFYKPQDLAIGSKIKAFKHCFIITDADEYVLKYMKERSQEFPQDMIDALEKKHKN